MRMDEWNWSKYSVVDVLGVSRSLLERRTEPGHMACDGMNKNDRERVELVKLIVMCMEKNAAMVEEDARREQLRREAPPVVGVMTDFVRQYPCLCLCMEVASDHKDGKNYDARIALCTALSRAGYSADDIYSFFRVVINDAEDNSNPHKGRYQVGYWTNRKGWATCKTMDKHGLCVVGFCDCPYKHPGDIDTKPDDSVRCYTPPSERPQLRVFHNEKHREW